MRLKKNSVDTTTRESLIISFAGRKESTSKYSEISKFLTNHSHASINEPMQGSSSPPPSPPPPEISVIHDKLINNNTSQSGIRIFHEHAFSQDKASVKYSM